MLLHSNSNRSDNEDENKNVVIQLQKIDPIIKNWLELEWFFQSGGEEEANVQHNFISSVVWPNGTEHDLYLREVLWQKAIHFIIETANMVGHDKLDDTKIILKLSIGLRVGLVDYMMGREGAQVRLLMEKIL